MESSIKARSSDDFGTINESDFETRRRDRTEESTMSRYVFVLVLLAAVIAASIAKSTEKKNESCPKHEVSSPCGRHCEPSCGNPRPSPYACQRQSCTAEMRGCRCKPDLCRNRKGKCVEQEKCKKDR